MRTACIVMTVIFAQFAYFQRNDLDEFNTDLWYLWVAVYGLCSLLALLSYFRALPRWFYLSCCLASLAVALIRIGHLTPGEKVFLNENNPAGNEAGGLVIVAIWYAALFWRRQSLIDAQS